jgi:anti-sigma factor RsiW
MKGAYPELTCQQLVEIVTEYLEGTLPRDDRTRFEMHLCYCDGCRAYLQQMRAVREVAGRLSEESIAPEARDALLEAFRGWKRGGGGGAA